MSSSNLLILNDPDRPNSDGELKIRGTVLFCDNTGFGSLIGQFIAYGTFEVFLFTSRYSFDISADSSSSRMKSTGALAFAMPKLLYFKSLLNDGSKNLSAPCSMCLMVTVQNVGKVELKNTEDVQ